jgi:hypothetical protein
LQLGSIEAAAALPNLLAGSQLAGRESSIIGEYFEPRQKKQLTPTRPTRVSGWPDTNILIILLLAQTALIDYELNYRKCKKRKHAFI